jgi:hypothetical protein
MRSNRGTRPGMSRRLSNRLRHFAVKRRTWTPCPYYRTRTRDGIVGTAQIAPPLPNKYAGPQRGPAYLFFRAMFEPARKQVQAEAARCVASRNRRRDQLSGGAAKAILPPLPIKKWRPLWAPFFQAGVENGHALVSGTCSAFNTAPPSPQSPSPSSLITTQVP